MKYNKIYFDLDGVLADFDKGVRELCGIDLTTSERTEELDNLMWEKIKGINNFYNKLDLIDNASELFNLVFNKYKDNCEVLTGVPKAKRGIMTACKDKETWSRRMLSKDVKVNTVYKEDKKFFCTGKECVLIDDTEKNIEEWESFGGTGVLFTTVNDTIEKLKELGVL